MYPPLHSRTLVERRYALLAAAVLLLAAFNLTFRLNSEIVTEWDEALYANSAWEMVTSGHWIGTTLLGKLDYYNTKPPLNVWLISVAFKTFGTSLVSLRLTSVVSAWLTVAVFMHWVRRKFGDVLSIVAGLVLSTTFGFLYDHSGRSGNTDALFTLLVLLTAFTLWTASARAWRLAWLGPLAAAVFLLRGMAVLLPVAIVLAVESWRALQRRRDGNRRAPLAVAALLFAAPVGLWMAARWQLDEWRFISRIFTYDMAARIFTVIEDHPGTPLYYLNILQRNHFEWVFAGLLVLMVCALSWRRLPPWLALPYRIDQSNVVMSSWALLTIAIPTLMRTKLSWYLNPFYPVFALGTGWLFVQAFTEGAPWQNLKRWRIAVVALFVVALLAAEGRLVWYSYHRRALTGSAQGILLAEQNNLKGHRVFSDKWTHSELFLMSGIIGGEHLQADTVDDFLRASQVGDYLMTSPEATSPALLFIRGNARHGLFRRRE